MPRLSPRYLCAATVILVSCHVVTTRATEIARALEGPDALDAAVAAFRAREDRILSGSMRAVLRLTEENPQQLGGYSTFGNGNGTLVSAVDFLMQGGKWRLNMRFTKSVDPHAPVVPGENSLEFSNDGVREMHLYRPTAQGAIIARPEVNDAGWVSGNVTLPSEFWLTYQGVRLSEWFSRPAARTTVETLVQGDQVVYILDGFEPKTGCARLRVYLNPNYGFAVERAELHIETGLLRSFQAKGMYKLEEGLWMPKTWTVAMHSASGDATESQPQNPRHWILKSAKLDVPVKKNAFEVEFPPGTRVSDNMAHKGWQVGSTTYDEDLWHKAMQAKPRSPSIFSGGVDPPRAANSSTSSRPYLLVVPNRAVSSRAYWSVVVNGCLLCVVTVLFLRHRRAQARMAQGEPPNP